MNGSERSAPLVSHLAIGLVSAGVLLYEIAITRVLSVLLWYHFAFLAISIALLGVSVPGVWFSIWPPRSRALPISLMLAGLLFPASIASILLPGSNLEHRLPLFVVEMLAPLLAAGSAIYLLLARAPGSEVGRMYGADLLGAMAGAVSVVALMNTLPTPILIAGIGFFPIAALMLLEPRARKIGLVMTLVLAGLLAWGNPFQLRNLSKTPKDGAELRFMRWTPSALLTIFGSEPGASTDAFFWGMGSRYTQQKVDQLWVELDGSAGTPITHFDRPIEALDHFFFDVTSVGYQLRPPRRVCVIGSGGGRDVLTALKGGATDIDAVEFNEHLIAAVSGPFKAFSGDVYHLPGVHAIASEGRSYLSHSRGGYDLIQLSLVDSWAATAAGAFSMSENNLYTLEAYRLYWDRLSLSGFVSTSRWMTGTRQTEIIRLLLMAEEMLRQVGIEHPEQHLALIQAGSIGTLLISRTRFDDQQLARLDQIVGERGFVQHWPPHATTPRGSLVPEVFRDGPQRIKAWGFELEPPTDDRPFFFQTLPLIGSIAEPARLELSFNEASVLVLRWLLGGIAALTMLLFFLPFALRRRLQPSPDMWRGSAYFLCVGAGFMLVEIPTTQRFILLLGHPSHATTVVLASLLLGAGLGATRASRTSLVEAQRLGFVLPLVLAGATVSLQPLIGLALGLHFALRAAIACVCLVPVGYLMGFAFPLGMVRFGDRRKAWFWAVNGAGGVLASVGSVALALLLGFTRVMALGLALYLVALLLLRPADDTSR